MKRDILVIDDDNSFGWLLGRILNDEFNVVNVPSGIFGMKWLSEGNLPCMILCDYNLPIITGIEFKEKLNLSGSFGQIPFILITAMLDSELEAKSKAVGIKATLQKPFDPRVLKETIESVIAENKIKAPVNG